MDALARDHRAQRIVGVGSSMSIMPSGRLLDADAQHVGAFLLERCARLLDLQHTLPPRK
jgi:hypothetical protein